MIGYAYTYTAAVIDVIAARIGVPSLDPHLAIAAENRRALRLADDAGLPIGRATERLIGVFARSGVYARLSHATSDSCR